MSEKPAPCTDERTYTRAEQTELIRLNDKKFAGWVAWHGSIPVADIPDRPNPSYSRGFDDGYKAGVEYANRTR